MDKQKNIMYKHFFNHANIIYASTLVAHVALFPLFIYIQNIPVLIAMTLAFMSSIAALYLNYKQRFGLASFIYLFFLALHATVEVTQFGLAPGFHYYYFNIAALIVFTPWKNIYKYVGIFLQIILFIVILYVVRNSPTVHPLSTELILFFQIINITLNIIGVSNSSSYYISIAQIARNELELLAGSDPLTKLPNRMGLWHFINHVLPASDKANALGTMMIDIDHFKAINDTHGHLCGDALLVDLAQLLKTITPPTGLVCRYGGEEFLILNFVQSPSDLLEFGERLRATVEQQAFTYKEHTLHITVSIGALFTETLNVDFELMLSHADALLYQAKDDGRNRVVMNSFLKVL